MTVSCSRALATAILGLVLPACAPHPPRAAETQPARGFRHPGVLLNGAQLAWMKERAASGDEPWAGAVAKLKSSRFADLGWTPRPRAVVECGPYSRPNLGCTDEREDAIAAYAHALLFTISGDRAHAVKAVEILDAWPPVLRDHTNHNAPLQSAWAASVWPRAAEIVRHTSDVWPAPEVRRFEGMLRRVYLREFAKGSAHTNGNWELSMIEAMIGIAVFTDDRALFERALSMWRRRVPAYFYTKADGPRAVPAPGGHDDTPEKVVKRWYGQSRLEDGVAQETCRDLGHTQYGIAAALNAAETARQQGVDLYSAEAGRLEAALERHAGYLLGEPVPEWLCGGRLEQARAVLPTWEIGYNHLARREGRSLPRTERLIRERVRTHRSGLDAHFILWETLTHAEAAAVGL